MEQKQDAQNDGNRVESGQPKREMRQILFVVQTQQNNPRHQQQLVGQRIEDRAQLAALGEVRTPSIADLFVAVMSPPSSRSRGTPARQADQIGATQ